MKKYLNNFIMVIACAGEKNVEVSFDLEESYQYALEKSRRVSWVLRTHGRFEVSNFKNCIKHRTYINIPATIDKKQISDIINTAGY